MGSAQGADQVKKPRFRATTELGARMFELQMAKKSIKMNILTYLGFHILQLGKLRMLEFGFWLHHCARLYSIRIY